MSLSKRITGLEKKTPNFSQLILVIPIDSETTAQAEERCRIENGLSHEAMAKAFKMAISFVSAENAT